MVACHVRRGDYTTFDPQGSSWFRTVPTDWFKTWIEAQRRGATKVVVYVATDDPDSVLPELKACSPLSAREAPAGITLAPEILDFEMLRRADHLAFVNSTFSRWAAFLAPDAQEGFAPNFEIAAIERYDAWSGSSFLQRYGAADRARHGEGASHEAARHRSIKLRREVSALLGELQSPVEKSERPMIDYRKVLARYRIEPKGVIHVGAHGGTENQTYIAIGFANRLFVEAQPDTFGTLSAALAGTGSLCENIAVSNRNGKATFHHALDGQSSSILPLNKHLDVHPDIVETKSCEVDTIRLDDLLARDAYATMSFNFLNIDIQGAELLVLSDAVQTLRKMELLKLEINFDELYEGAPHVRELDSFLAAFGFVRADTFLWHALWGDAIYVRTSIPRA